MPETFEEALQTSGGVDLTGLRSEGAGGDTLVLASDPATWRRAFRFICARRTEPIASRLSTWYWSEDSPWPAARASRSASNPQRSRASISSSRTSYRRQRSDLRPPDA
jgi:hypothetical protein